MPGAWSVYIALCGDGTLYTGITKDVEARILKHNSGRGAAYTRSRLPLRLAYSRNGMTQRQALSLEARIKRLGRGEKEALIGEKAAPSLIA